MTKTADLTGQRFGRLVALRYIGRNKDKKRLWLCKCDCGKEKAYIVSRLRLGDNGLGKVSCGCAHFRHGMHGTPEYVSWACMMYRCYRKADIAYARYGGRGIKVCEFLRVSPKNLLVLLGAMPTGTTLDRIKNTHGYNCGKCRECLSNRFECNVRWASRELQNRNRRTARLVEINGTTRHLFEVADELHCSRSTAIRRYSRGIKGAAIFA